MHQPIKPLIFISLRVSHCQLNSTLWYKTTLQIENMCITKFYRVIIQRNGKDKILRGISKISLPHCAHCLAEYINELNLSIGISCLQSQCNPAEEVKQKPKSRLNNNLLISKKVINIDNNKYISTFCPFIESLC